MAGAQLRRAITLVENETGDRVESARLVEQMTTSEGSALVYVVETDQRAYWVVEDDAGEDVYPRREYRSADAALDAHVETTAP
ncbi:hypothetical protein [Halomarina rubra]|uniref:Uncharacterized protein n=1 Tax=Halomarina rubra TaxID=2071873 RepID=A0ABD6AVG0_9EURY|nr:hypothetical protein [Halomarina rubra]